MGVLDLSGARLSAVSFFNILKIKSCRGVDLPKDELSDSKN
jgi:hypothetical protein